MNNDKREAIFARLKAQNPHPETELNFNNHYELLVAVALSAQSTDVSVNKATKKEEKEIKKYVNNCFGYQKKQQIAQKITGQIAAYIRENPDKAPETIELIEDIFQIKPEKLS